ncbi:hypothetical protein DN752_19470 [Echinicola strongylocentroti]|uniref:Uncharacterized protein n=1 Tax=Echinicola strongylocentroti TaxID=1795355 RepID=A0A2Z4IP71_9BACT|nr:hypothetical protein [Echinicola strongylocentroti]AWW32143.1 hypothetical protein DN752_19470 [Echinicola strongylocentroti]
MVEKQDSEKRVAQQVRIWLSPDEYAKLNELKFKEKRIHQETRDFAKELILEGISKRDKK